MSVPGRAARGSSIALAVLLAAGCAEPVRLQRQWQVLGVEAAIDVQTTTRRGAADVVEEVQRACRKAEATMTLADPASELSRLNAEAWRAPYKVRDPDLYHCIEVAREWARATAGAFDPTVGALRSAWGLREPAPRAPGDAQIAAALERTGWRKLTLYREAGALRLLEPGMQLDLDGIVEGYVVDIAARRFSRIGVRAGRVRVGHTRYVWLVPPLRNGPSSVSIDDPADPRRRIAEVPLVNRALSVSGSFAALFGETDPPAVDLLDPSTGRPADSNVAAAAVLADSGADAQVVGRALRVMGSARAGALLDRAPRLQALLLVRGAAGPYLLASGSLRGRLELDPALPAGVEIRYLLP